jgi:hypothetical protein
VTGYRESDVLAICTLSTPSFTLPYVVHRCTDFEDKGKPDWEQMEKLAIQIAPVRVSKKTRGFSVPEVLQPEKPEFEPAVAAEDEDECEDVDAVAECLVTP